MSRRLLDIGAPGRPEYPMSDQITRQAERCHSTDATTVAWRLLPDGMKSLQLQNCDKTEAPGA